MHGDAKNLADCTVLTGANLDHLPTFADCVFDSCVTDPPYELGFMGKAWDKSGIAYSGELWREVYRVLKPGAYLLAFGGSRTYHRMACAIEDAGFEIRDQIQWIYGSGFPKSLDVSKAIDREAGVERSDAIKGGHMAAAGRSHGIETINAGGLAIENRIPSVIGKGSLTRGTPSTDDAKTWDGWGTALKPAHEPIVMARKPLEKGLTVAQNVLKWGTGAINIDKCRVEGNDADDLAKNWDRFQSVNQGIASTGIKAIDLRDRAPSGRFPANVIHDGSDEVLAGFPHTASGAIKAGTPYNHSNCKTMGAATGVVTRDFDADEGSAARFFYSPKASKYDREAGLPEAGRRTMEGGTLKHGESGGGVGSPSARNHHPTVKPTDLMQYLCRLVTPPGGLVLDPFLGSGSTAKAALIERCRIVGIELNPEYAAIADARCKSLQVKLF